MVQEGAALRAIREGRFADMPWHSSLDDMPLASIIEHDGGLRCYNAGMHRRGIGSSQMALNCGSCLYLAEGIGDNRLCLVRSAGIELVAISRNSPYLSVAPRNPLP